MTRKIIATIAMLIIIVGGSVLAFQATKHSTHADNTLKVAASYYPLYDFARNVGGDKVSVINMTPAGSEPHDYDPSPQSLIDAHSAKVFIYNGGQMEPWVDSFITDYTHTTVKANKDIEMLEVHGDDGHDHDHGATDPHFWLDPVIARQIVNNIRDGLSQSDPDNKDYYAANAASYNQKLVELDTRFTSGLEACTLDTVVSSHSAFSYLADRYGFIATSIAGIEPDDEPSPAKMAELTNIVRQKNIKYVFFESLVSPRLAETIASEAGAQTLIFDPIEGLSQEDQDKGRDYISVQYDNLENLRKALDCK